MRRQKYLAINQSHVIAIIDGSLRVDNLPEGTRFIRAFIDQYTNALCFIIEHDSFDEVPEGDSVPWLPASYNMNYRNKTE